MSPPRNIDLLIKGNAPTVQIVNTILEEEEYDEKEECCVTKLHLQVIFTDELIFNVSCKIHKETKVQTNLEVMIDWNLHSTRIDVGRILRVLECFNRYNNATPFEFTENSTTVFILLFSPDKLKALNTMISTIPTGFALCKPSEVGVQLVRRFGYDE